MRTPIHGRRRYRRSPDVFRVTGYALPTRRRRPLCRAVARLQWPPRQVGSPGFSTMQCAQLRDHEIVKHMDSALGDGPARHHKTGRGCVESSSKGCTAAWSRGPLARATVTTKGVLLVALRATQQQRRRFGPRLSAGSVKWARCHLSAQPRRFRASWWSMPTRPGRLVNALRRPAP